MEGQLYSTFSDRGDVSVIRSDGRMETEGAEQVTDRERLQMPNQVDKKQRVEETVTAM